MFVYVGTYSKVGQPGRGRAEGIYVYRLDPQTGELSHLHTIADLPNPSFLALHPQGDYLYAVNETLGIDGHPGGAVSAFARDTQTGALTFLNREDSHGSDPCHLDVDPTGKCVLVANYTSGSVAALPLGTDGRVGPATFIDQHRGSSANPDRQQGPHAHSIPVAPGGRFALCPDLGMDRVFVYRLDAANATMTHHDPVGTPLAPGAGPRHLDFHPNGRWVYVINELDSTITAFTWDGDQGTLGAIQTVSTLPAGFGDSTTCADIHVAPSGRFVYGSNRGHDSIATFAIDGATGRLTPVGHTPTGGKTPRNFAIDPSGTFLFAANQNSDTIVTFRLDPETGLPVPTGQVTAVPSPVCLRMGE